jgi:glycine/D-amino acid oxidase-like deaminating enzyme/nitrite reductase/ring-hydroxylating ferredoxin subunit
MPAAEPDKTSLWVARARTMRPAEQTLTMLAGTSPEVVVIGGGLAGLCTALRLHEDGRRVAVVEADRIGRRTTGHSTAKITALQGTTYSSISKGKGGEAAALYAAASTAGVAALRDVITRLKIDCGLTDAPNYTCAATDAGVRSIEEEAEAARAAGLPVELTTTTDLPFAVPAAVRLDGQAHFDPVAFCDALAIHLRRAGVPIIEGTRVNAVEEERDRCTVRVGDTTISCDYAVITTHLPITDPALLAGRTHPERSYAVSGPVPDGASAQIAGMYLATDTGWSIRPVRGGTEKWLVVGGEGHSMQDHVTSSDHYRRLEWWARDRLGVDVRHSWSAFDYAPTDGVPFIGRLAPRTSRRFVATGFRKWGMSNSMVAARLIGDLLAGTQHPAHALFDASRILPTLGRDAVKANMKVAAHFIGDRLQARRAPSPDDLGPGEGRIMRVGGRAVAAARAADGTLHTVKATCTHLGCLVAFNDSDQTWDCPCHGSRFALDGSVIDGPASTPLDAVDASSPEATENASR